MIRILRGTMATLAALALSGTAHANLLSNGDFATGDLTGWSASGDVLAIPQTDYTACCGTLNDTPGAYVASFGAGNMPDNGVLSQSFPTTVGLGYVVSFDYGAVDFSLPQNMNVSIVSGANALGASLSATGTNDFDTLFALYSYSFTAEATTTTLTFTDTSSVTDNVDGLVALVSAETAPTGEVPEPPSFALLGVGLAGMAVRRVVRGSLCGCRSGDSRRGRNGCRPTAPALHYSAASPWRDLCRDSCKVRTLSCVYSSLQLVNARSVTLRGS
jgi:hypothetical protein